MHSTGDETVTINHNGDWSGGASIFHAATERAWVVREAMDLVRGAVTQESCTGPIPIPVAVLCRAVSFAARAHLAMAVHCAIDDAV